METETCSVCTNPRFAKGFCRQHYNRQYRGKDVLGPIRLKLPDGTPPYERVMARVVREGDCLVFTGSRDHHGYGRVNDGTGTGAPILVHRVVAERHLGPSDLDVLHSCDNPPCVEITHLRYGTQRENTHDSITKGRMRGRALTDEQVEAIRADPRTQGLIAADYGISRAYVSQLKSRRRRKD